MKKDLGLVKGPKGDKGDTGPQGKQGVAGKDATVNGYNVATLTATGNVELEQTDGAMELRTTPELDAAVQWHSNRNLLDNWYFTGGGSQKGGGRFPINQRGQTEYTQNGYCVDRWAIGSTPNGTVSLDENGLRLETKGELGYLFQEIEASRTQVGKTLTFSVLLADGKILSASGIFPDTKDTDTIFASKDDGSVAIVIVRLRTSLNGYLHPQIQFRNNGTTIVAAKLEEGPVQTLAHREGDAWVLNEAPDYGEELAKCQRYYQIFTVSDKRPEEAEDFRPVMRIRPVPDTIVVNGKTYYTADANL